MKNFIEGNRRVLSPRTGYEDRHRHKLLIGARFIYL